ncbi:MAG: lysophospholipid acyltransferase family protein [Crocinitomicaceae bacterium]|nr:lysophospholipid acyltransferase family protein [Crocinitomicaceae bacterium]
MLKLVYYTILIPFSYLPFKVLWYMSDVAYYILYYALNYRKDVVRMNLRNAFPNKTPEELKIIERNYYHHLCSLFFEIMKTISFNRNLVEKHFQIEENADLKESFKNGRDVIFMCGHFNNWELWASAMPYMIDHQCVAVYKPLSNSYAEIKAKEVRERHGMKMISMNESLKYMYKHQGNKSAYIFLADQSPSNMSKVRWNTFLNQDTPWMLGGTSIGKKLGMDFYFAYIEQLERGKFKVHFKKISDANDSLKDVEIIDLYSENLEEVIRENPQFWLWSHKRWKHKKQDHV